MLYSQTFRIKCRYKLWKPALGNKDIDTKYECETKSISWMLHYHFNKYAGQLKFCITKFVRTVNEHLTISSTSLKVSMINLAKWIFKISFFGKWGSLCSILLSIHDRQDFQSSANPFKIK